MPPNRPALSRAQSREVDRYAIEELGFPGIMLMENAGRGCVDVMEKVGINGKVVVVTGKGNNAGDGFVIARHLAIRGYTVKVALGASAHTLKGDARTAFMTLIPCRVPILDLGLVHAGEKVAELDALGDGAEWIVDALLGTGATGSPRPPFDALIDWINGETSKKLAVDVPSGLDCDTGQLSPTTVWADHTCTFVAPKVGFESPGSKEFLGELHVVDIGVPQHAVDRALNLAPGH